MFLSPECRLVFRDNRSDTVSTAHTSFEGRGDRGRGDQTKMLAIKDSITVSRVQTVTLIFSRALTLFSPHERNVS